MPAQRPDIDTRALARAYVANRLNAAATAREFDLDPKTVKLRLERPEGRAIVDEFVTAQLEQYSVSATRVVGEAAAIAFADLPSILSAGTSLETLATLPPHLRAAIQEVQSDAEGNVTKVRLHGKLDALKLLAGYLDLHGLGATTAEDAAGTRPELGGLTIIGATEEAKYETQHSPRGVIPKPEKLD